MQKPNNDEFELVVSDCLEPRTPPGFHETRTRLYYVTGSGCVYLLAAPGQRAMLQAVEHLPADATPSSRLQDLRVRTLADVADDLTAGPHRSMPA